MGAVISRVLGFALLALLYVVPIDMMTAGFFFIAFFVFVAALRTLSQHRKRPRAAVLAALVTAVMFPGSCANQVAAWGAVSKRVYALGDVAHELCRRDGVCPTIEALCGQADCGTAGTTVRHTVRYGRSDDGLRFAVWTRLSIDDQVSAEGGVGVPLVHVTRTDNDERRIEVSSGTAAQAR